MTQRGFSTNENFEQAYQVSIYQSKFGQKQKNEHVD